jgi:putative oxidoreductase
MKTVSTLVRLLLGLIVFVFGLNGFLHFIPSPPMPGPEGAFIGAVAATGYMMPLIFTTQVVAGILLLIGLYAPLAVAILAPVIVNIFFFHVFLAPGGLPVAIVVIALELFTAWSYRGAFAPMLRST